MSTPAEALTVGDLLAAIGVVAGVPEDDEIRAVRVYPNLARVEFVGVRGVYRTTLDAVLEDRHPEVDTSEADAEAEGKAPAKGK